MVNASSFTHSSVLLSTTGLLQFGPGTTTVDTNFYRSGVGALQTDGTFTAAGSLTTPTVYGSSAASGNLQLYSTSNPTRGQILFGSAAVYDGVSGSFQFGSTTLSLGGGTGVIGVANAVTPPTTNPTGGGILYAASGLPTWRDPSGNTYNLASAGSTVNTPLPDDQAIKAWTYDPALASNATAPTAGQLQLMRFILRSGQTISTIYLDINGLGSVLASGQNLVGLYTSAGALIDGCGDQTVAWGSTGLKAGTLGSSHALTSGIYYVGFVANGTSSPTFARGNGLAGAANMNNLGLTTSTCRFGTNGSGVTSLPATITMSSNTFAAVSFWAAVA
jgi:hypothetical protein